MNRRCPACSRLTSRAYGVCGACGPVSRESSRMHCAVRERTGDGVSVGRCYHFVGVTYQCHRHGDVREIQEHWVRTGTLSEDPRAGRTGTP